MSILAKASASIITAFLVAGSAFAGQLTLETNKTRPLRLAGEAASVIIGNPGIADVAVLDEHMLLLTGKTFGTTNLIVFDKDGRQIYSSDVVVTTSTSSLVTINRAGQSNTYDCASDCRSVLAVGDQAAYFSTLKEQNEDLQDLALGN
ncbi:MAG: pilus assembly protein N-terminal domain-containing protein [Hyphomonadaceae bacterium]